MSPAFTAIGASCTLANSIQPIATQQFLHLNPFAPTRKGGLEPFGQPLPELPCRRLRHGQTTGSCEFQFRKMCRQKLRVRRCELQLCPFVWRKPSALLPLSWLRHALRRQFTSHIVQLNRLCRIGKSLLREKLRVANLQSEFLLQFPRNTRLQSLARIHFPARELPLSGKGSPRPSRRQQHLSTPENHGGAHRQRSHCHSPTPYRPVTAPCPGLSVRTTYRSPIKNSARRLSWCSASVVAGDFAGLSSP